MFYYKVESSHWKNNLEFKSKIQLTEGQCFRIKQHDGLNNYPTRFKVKSISDVPEYIGTVVEILEVDTNVDTF
jgi:hypothetical protein